TTWSSTLMILGSSPTVLLGSGDLTVRQICRRIVDSPLRAAALLGGRRILSRGVARVAGRGAPRAPAPARTRRVDRTPRLGHRLAEAAVRRRLRRFALARRLRGEGRLADRAAHLLRGDRASAGSLRRRELRRHAAR